MFVCVLKCSSDLKKINQKRPLCPAAWPQRCTEYSRATRFLSKTKATRLLLQSWRGLDQYARTLLTSPGLLSQSFQSCPNHKGQTTWREDRSESGSSCIKDWGVMGFGGEEGGVNLINNKSPSAPQSHALCLIAPYWFFSLFFFSFLGRALLSFRNNQVAKVDLRVECHLFSLLLLLLHHPPPPLIFFLFSPFLVSPSSWCLLCFTLFVASQLSRLS